MSALTLSIRKRPRRVALSLLTRAGPEVLDGGPEAVAQLIAAIGPIGPIGPQGPQGEAAVTRYDVSAAATWIVAHGLDHRPIAQVFLASGEQVLADVAVDAVNINVTFASPTAGFVLAC